MFPLTEYFTLDTCLVLALTNLPTERIPDLGTGSVLSPVAGGGGPLSLC